MSILSAKYLYDEDGVTKTHVQLKLGSDRYEHVPVSAGNSRYAEIMRQVEAGELTIQEAN
jgi:hypothetical protein